MVESSNELPRTPSPRTRVSKAKGKARALCPGLCTCGRFCVGCLQLQPGTLTFLVAGRVVAAGRGRAVRLALQVLGDPVVLDHQPTHVLVGLEVSEDRVATRDHAGLVGEELQIPVDAGVDHPPAPVTEAVLEVHAAPDRRTALHGDGLEALALDVADYAYAVGEESGAPLDCNG